MTGDELLHEARRLLEMQRTVDVVAGRWPRATALLGRQALETYLKELWDQSEPGLATCSTRAQLLALAAYLDDAEVAERAASTWWALTTATHYHPYELVPTAAELDGWLVSVEQLGRCVHARTTEALA